MVAILLALTLALTPISPTSHLVRDIRAVRGDVIATSSVLNHMAASRVGWPGHAGLGDACPPVIDGHRVSLCGEIKGWYTTTDLDWAVDWVVPAWTASPPHNAIMYDLSWRWIGVAVRQIGGFTWLVADFAR